MKKKLKNFYTKYKEQILYLIFGVLTTLLSIFIFYILNSVFFINELVANVVAWVLCVAFAFFTNRIWVFKQNDNDKKILYQIILFYLGRLSTLGIEEGILAIFAIWLKYDSLTVKIVSQVIVIVLNYIISKLIVFRNNNK